MELATPEMIPKIDSFAEKVLGIPTSVLMGRSGAAVAREIRGVARPGARVLFLLGKGNNGGDGYAAALLLSDFDLFVCDVFSVGQRTETGKHYLAEYSGRGGKFIDVDACIPFINTLGEGDVIVDGIFGTGFFGTPPSFICDIIRAANASAALRVAIDIPLGVNALDGSVGDTAFRADVTVALSYSKPGLHSYPAKGLVGRLCLDEIGVCREAVRGECEFKYFLTDAPFAAAALPRRADNSSKGSFGKTLLLTGSDKYRGAAHLALEAALRGGAGLVIQAGSDELCSELRAKFPEAIYHGYDTVDPASLEPLLSLSDGADTVLAGSGSGVSKQLCELTLRLLDRSGGALILDADAINSIARFGSSEDFLSAKRTVVLTPHPLEFSRLSGFSVEHIQAHRIECAEKYAAEYGVILVLKGAATVVTDGNRTFINSTGSSALAKGGSGDVLAGLCASLLIKSPDPLASVALAVYLHGRAGDELEEELSSFGVTPSDIPRRVGKIISKLITEKEVSDNE